MDMWEYVVANSSLAESDGDFWEHLTNPRQTTVVDVERLVPYDYVGANLLLDSIGINMVKYELEVNIEHLEVEANITPDTPLQNTHVLLCTLRFFSGFRLVLHSPEKYSSGRQKVQI